MSDELDQLILSFQVDEGQPGVDDDLNNPLARATRNLLVEGQPFKKLNLSFFKDSEDSEPIRWFGSFVFSSAGRIIYFPGFTFQSSWIKLSKKDGPESYDEINIDHLTLEKDLKRWHYTNIGSSRHIGKGKTQDLGENRFLWFGMSLADVNLLRILKQKTSFEFSIPSSDTKRRTNSLIDSRDGMIFNILHLHPDAKKHFVTGFIHFTVIIGKSGFPEYNGPLFSPPYGSLYVKGEPKLPLLNIPMRSHRLKMGAHFEIQIITSFIPGSLHAKAVFTFNSPT